MMGLHSSAAFAMRKAWLSYASEGTCDASDAAVDGAMPARPAVPPVLFIAASLWAALLALSGAYPKFLPDALLAAFALTAGAIALAVAVRPVLRARLHGAPTASATQGKRGGGTVRSFLVVGVCLGIALSCANELSLRDGERGIALDRPGKHVFTAVADATPSDWGFSVLASAELATGDTARVRVLLDEGTVPLCGERFEASTTVREADPAVAARYRGQGVVATLEAYTDATAVPGVSPFDALGALRRRAVSLFDRYDGPGAALCKAVLFGERADLSTEAADFYADAKVAGLAHLIAVSGSHLVLVVGVVETVMRAARVPRAARIVVSTLFMASYVVLTGVAISAVRAAIMCCVSLAAPLARRRGGGLAGISVCSIALLATDPSCATSLSLQLSAVSTLAIAAFMPLASAWIAAALPVVPESLRETLAMTLAASLLSIPLTAPVFAQAPLVSPLANVVAAPFFAALCLGGLAACGISLALPSASFVLTPIVLLAQAFADVTAVLANVPYAAVPFSGSALSCALAGCAVAVSVWTFWPRPSRVVARGMLCAVALAVLLLIAVPSAVPRLSLLGQGSEVVAFDVGQGDAFLVRSEGHTLLVDTGMQDTALLEGLGALGIARLDAVLVTHPDADHCASLPALHGVVEVGRVLVAEDGLVCPCENCDDLRRSAERTAPGAVEGLSPGDKLRMGKFTARIVGPGAYQDEGGNVDSVCFVLEYREHAEDEPAWTALFTGDAEADVLQEYVEAGLVGDVDLLKVAHHGARAGLTEELAAELSPEVALVSVGADNSYGHPTSEVLRMLDAVGARTLRTDEDGTVTCRFRADVLDVSASKRPMG